MPSTAADVHLSDVHLHCPGSTSAADEISRFAFSTDSAETSAAAADGDGDQVLKRRRAGRSGALKLRHALATPLPDVGLQVWRGALLLCDYLLARPALVSGATILELGAGCGLCGLLAAGTARRVFVTDNVEGVLANAQANVELNGVEAVARVRTLDWAEPVLPSDATEEEAQPSAHCHPAGDDAGGAPSAGARPAAVDPFAWSAEERAELRDCNLVLAADCVYGYDTLTLTLTTDPKPKPNPDPNLTLYLALNLTQTQTQTHHTDPDPNSEPPPDPEPGPNPDQATT
jgi:predicted nicotinamide N-methyase|tara:strand:+ start:73 stop:936 length:864 start_codon:yes stop_codon:yes gene_type:complete